MHAGREFFDDVIGQSLNHALAGAARKLERHFFKKMGVYIKVPRGEATSNRCRVTTIRWLEAVENFRVGDSISNGLV